MTARLQAKVLVKSMGCELKERLGDESQSSSWLLNII